MSLSLQVMLHILPYTSLKCMYSVLDKLFLTHIETDVTNLFVSYVHYVLHVRDDKMIPKSDHSVSKKNFTLRFSDNFSQMVRNF